MQERGFYNQCTNEEGFDNYLYECEKAGKPAVGYLGSDPTGDSLHVGHIVPLMMLRWFQKCGHKPLTLVGGATARIGDPSGKDKLRPFLDEATLAHNTQGLKKSFSKFLKFGDGPTDALMVDNWDWFKNVNYLEFLRDIGTCYSVNRMLTMDSVKSRLEREQPMSFLEFNYMLLQGYDFLHLYKNKGVKLQLGGNDQWGNMTTGTELIRRTLGSEVETFALTCPLITKADGTKFGKTESGNVWLDPKRTSPYKFYQFWLNVSDDDAVKYIKIFTSLDKPTIDALIEEHAQDPGRRVLQRRLADEVTVLVHSQEALEAAIEASNILFGKSTKDSLHRLDEQTLLDIFDGVPQFEIDKSQLNQPAVELFTQAAPVFASKGEMRKLVQGGGVSLNKEKLEAFDQLITDEELIAGKYLLVQRGKKNYTLLIVK